MVTTRCRLYILSPNLETKNLKRKTYGAKMSFVYCEVDDSKRHSMTDGYEGAIQLRVFKLITISHWLNFSPSDWPVNSSKRTFENLSIACTLAAAKQSLFVDCNCFWTTFISFSNIICKPFLQIIFQAKIHGPKLAKTAQTDG